MTILKTKDGYEISMQSYIEDILQLYAKKLKEYVVPTRPNLFKVDPEVNMIKEKAKIIVLRQTRTPRHPSTSPILMHTSKGTQHRL
jgi:hypothetical protein